LEFDVFGVSSIIQNPTESVTMRTRVIINVLDVDDNCPSFTTPVEMTSKYSSPVPTNTIVGRMVLSDNDSQANHTLSVSDNFNFSVDSHGSIKTARTLESLTELNFTITVTAFNGYCSVDSKLLLIVTACPVPMLYMFTDNGNYEESVFENKTVNSNFSVVPRIQGNYQLTFSILEVKAKTMFSIDPNTGKTLVYFVKLRFWKHRSLFKTTNFKFFHQSF